MKKEWNEKQEVLLGVIGRLVYERDQDEKLLSKTEENKKWIDEFYNKRIEILNEILDEVK